MRFLLQKGLTFLCGLWTSMWVPSFQVSTFPLRPPPTTITGPRFPHISVQPVTLQRYCVDADGYIVALVILDAAVIAFSVCRVCVLLSGAAHKTWGCAVEKVGTVIAPGGKAGNCIANATDP